MAEIGTTAKGGGNRQTLTDEDQRGRDLFRTWCEEAGLHLSVDRMGNIRRRDESRPPVMLSLLLHVLSFMSSLPGAWFYFRGGVRA